MVYIKTKNYEEIKTVDYLNLKLNEKTSKVEVLGTKHASSICCLSFSNESDEVCRLLN